MTKTSADIFNVDAKTGQVEMVPPPSLSWAQKAYGNSLLEWAQPRISDFLFGPGRDNCLNNVEIAVIAAYLVAYLSRDSMENFLAFSSYLNWYSHYYPALLEEALKLNPSIDPRKILLLRSDNPVRPDAEVTFMPAVTDKVS